MKQVKTGHLTKEDECRIRRFLMTGMDGWEYPLEEGHEDPEKGWYPVYGTLRMAENAMLELLKLQAEVARLRADKAAQYLSKFLAQTNELGS